ncbi:MAG: four helix bundle protein [Flavobacteriales bacterium]
MNSLKDMDQKQWQNAMVEDELFAPLISAEAPVSYNPRYKDNTIVTLTFRFAQHIWDLAEELQDKRKFVVANQVFRSGTAIGALVREAQNGESLADFIHKMKIALKEADETEYWLLLCISRDIESAKACLEELRPIIRILNKIISSSKAKMNS